MIGDPGPYMDDDGGVWVPRTVSYLEARRVAREAMQYQDREDDKLVYRGKINATMFGFRRDCCCEDHCTLANRCRSCGLADGECDHIDPEDWDGCRAPAWAFEIVER